MLSEQSIDHIRTPSYLPAPRTVARQTEHLSDIDGSIERPYNQMTRLLWNLPATTFEPITYLGWSIHLVLVQRLDKFQRRLGSFLRSAVARTHARTLFGNDELCSMHLDQLTWILPLPHLPHPLLLASPLGFLRWPLALQNPQSQFHSISSLIILLAFENLCKVEHGDGQKECTQLV